MAEAAMLALAAEGMPRQEAHRLIRTLSAEAYTKKKELSAVLKDSKEISKLLDKEAIEEILAPKKYIGTAVEQVEKVLRVAREERK
jgi:adenylosuccinate lyase